MNVRATPRRTVTVVVAAMLATLLASTGAAWAYWTATANLTASIKLSDVRVALGSTAGLTTTFANEALVSTTSFTVSNPGSEAGTVTLSVVPGAASSLRGALRLELWRQAGGSCATTSGTVTTGTWATISAPVGNLAAGTTQTWCARTTATSREAIAHVSGTQSATTSLVASMSVSGGAVTDTATGTHTTRLVFPRADLTALLPANASSWFTIQRDQDRTRCFDVNSSGGAGSTLIGYPCHGDPNQRWRIGVADATAASVTLQPMHSGGIATRIAANGTNVQVATAQNVATQRWYLQAISATAFQMVDETGGRCLTLGAGSTDPSTVEACSDALRSRQVFRMTRHPLVIAQTGNQVRFSYSTTPGGANVLVGWDEVKLQASTNGTTWNDVTASARDDASLTVNVSALSSGSSTNYRIVRASAGTTYVLYSGIQITRSGDSITVVRGND